MKSIAASLILAASTFASATNAELYPRYLNSSSAVVLNSTIASNQTFTPPPCFTISEMRKVIPSCALSCQTLALKASSCPYEDTACHCANTAAISAVVEPCLAASDCSASDVTAFAAIVMPTCAFLNATTNGTLPASCNLSTDYDEHSSYDAPPSTASVPSKPVVTGYEYPAPPHSNATTPSQPLVTGHGYPAPPPPPPSNATKPSVTGHGYPSVSSKTTGMAIVPTTSSIGAPSSTPVHYVNSASTRVMSFGAMLVAGVTAFVVLS
jgi:hypothetical protein